MGDLALREVRESDAVDASLHAMLQQLAAKESGFENPGYGVSFDEFPGLIKRLLDAKDPALVAPDRVPQTLYWLLDGERPLGIAKIRHRLNEGLRKRGGHIGYGIAPGERGKGYGRRILALALTEIERLGVREVLITCDLDNVRSRRVIEANGGLLESDAEGHCRYWIRLP